MIKLELTEDEVHRILVALRAQEHACQDELDELPQEERVLPVLRKNADADAILAHCQQLAKELREIQRQCSEVARKIIVQRSGTW